MKRPQLRLNLQGEYGVLLKHLLPFVTLVASTSDRALAINLLGFNNKHEYVMAIQQDGRYGDMLAIIIFLFMLDDYDERKLFWDRISFSDRFLEKRLRELCGFEDEGLSVQQLDAIWELDSTE